MRRLLLASCLAFAAAAQADESTAVVDRLATPVKSKVVAWRRQIHQPPELGNRELQTAKLVADHLRSLGLQVRTASPRPAR